MVDRSNIRRARVAAKAADILRKQPVFLDTETTGLGPEDQVIDVAVVDCSGRVLLNTLVKPTVALAPEVTAVNGITPEVLEAAPTFREIMTDLHHAVFGRQVVTYGAGFDVKMIRQTADAWRLRTPVPGAFCAMLAYAEFNGQRAAWGQWKWQKLDAAAGQCGIPLPAQRHRALADAQLMRLVFLHMADYRAKGVTR